MHIKAILSKIVHNLNCIDHWPTLCHIVERLKPIQKWTQVIWKKAQEGTVKINTDGSYLHDSGRAGIGGIVRDSSGDLIMAFSLSVPCISSNMAEALAAEFGMKWCCLQRHTNFILELDSLVIANMVNNRGSNNLKLKQIIDRIVKLKYLHGVQVSHCYREGNQVADFLAKLASTSSQNSMFHSFIQLPREAKGLVQLDKRQMPSIRTKSDKANFFIS